MRYNTNKSGDKLISLEEYIAKMKPGQEKIYFIVSNSTESAILSPFMEPFKKEDAPQVLVLTNIDEFIFQSVGKFKEKKFVNIETSYEEISKDLGNTDQVQDSRIPEHEVANLCIWMKNELGSQISKVTISKRLTNTPAIVVGKFSSSMRMMMDMMEGV